MTCFEKSRENGCTYVREIIFRFFHFHEIFLNYCFCDENIYSPFWKTTALFKHFNFLKIEGYGLTESSSTGTVTDPDDLSLGCVGAPLLGMN